LKATVIVFVSIILFSSFAVNIQPASATEDSWTTLAEMPTPREGLGVAVVNGKIYAIGGNGGDGNLGVNEEYDPVTNTWATKKPLPTSRSRFGITVHQNKIYVMGGSTDSGFTGANEVYNPVTDTWEAKASMPAGGRSELAVNAVNDKIYAIGGYFIGVYWVPSNLTEVYNPATDTWTTKAQMPTAVYGCTSALIDSKIYVIENSYSGDATLFRLNQIYDAETDTWSFGQPIPIRMPEAAAAATTGVYAPKRVYVLGGFSDVSSYPFPFETQIYDPATDTWSTGTPMPTVRQSLGVAVVYDRLYAIGGFDVSLPVSNVFTGKNERHTPSGYGTVPQHPEPFPATLVLAVSAAFVVAVAGLVIHFRKRRRDGGQP
jgi:N-acetylneuraminic acid mutarotase